jgi:copper resistance protein D
LRITHRALERFSGVGTVLVGTLVATGLINSWFLVGPENVEGLLGTDYGLLLALKLALFAGMLALAGANRFGGRRDLKPPWARLHRLRKPFERSVEA